MPQRGRSRSSFRRGSRSKAVWSQSTFSHALPAGGFGFITNITHPAITNNSEPTGVCIRMLGNWSYSPDIGAAIGDYNVSMGVCVVTIDAFLASAVPDPASDVTQDWYFWNAWEGAMINTGLSNQTGYFDIRSARRLREGYRLVWVSENVVMELAGTLQVNLRTLWRMP